MGQDTFILIGLCLFMLLAGMRLKKRFSARKQPDTPPIRKNQRPKLAAEEPPLVKERRLRRERRTRYFTLVLLIGLFALLLFMIPSLVKDIMLPEGIVFSNFFLRCFIFILTIYIFFLGYWKLFVRGKKGKAAEKPE